MTQYTSVTIREHNEHGNGWEATAKVDKGLEQYVSFDICWQYIDLDDGSSETGESVGVLMSPEAAEELAHQLVTSAQKARRFIANSEETTIG